MKLWLGWGVRSTIVGFLVVLGATGCGREQNPVPFTWEATGVQVTRLDLSLAGEAHRFSVSEYVLEGQGAWGKSVRHFRDRALLTVDVLEHKGQLFGYVNRTYSGGGMVALRLYGRIEPVAGDPDIALVTGRVYPVGTDGAIINRLAGMDRIEIRLNPAWGKISARGF